MSGPPQFIQLAGGGRGPPPPPPIHPHGNMGPSPGPVRNPGNGGPHQIPNPHPPAGNRAPGVHFGAPSDGPSGTGGKAQPQPAKAVKKPERMVTGVLDLSKTRLKTSEGCYEKLTTYELYTLRKADPVSKDIRPTWERTQWVHESLGQAELLKQINYLGRKDKVQGKTVAGKQSRLYAHQAEVVSNLLETQKSQETDDQFEWTICQMDKEVGASNFCRKKETKRIALYLQRSPRKDLDALTVFKNLETAKKEAEQKKPAAQPKPAAPRQDDVGPLGNMTAMGNLLPPHPQQPVHFNDTQQPLQPHLPPGALPKGVMPGDKKGANDRHDKNHCDGGKRRCDSRRPRSRSRSRPRRKNHGSCGSDTSFEDCHSDSDHTYSTYSESRSTDSRTSRCQRVARRGRHRSHVRLEPRLEARERLYIDDQSPRQIVYRQQTISPATWNVAAYHHAADSSRFVLPPLVHQREVDGVYLAELRREEEYRRDRDAYIRAKRVALEEARDRRRFR